MDEHKEKLELMERDKERMIRQYLELQDKADETNEQIYKVCCGVETLNAQISALKEEIRKAGVRAATKPAGKAAPTNGTHKTT